MYLYIYMHCMILQVIYDQDHCSWVVYPPLDPPLLAYMLSSYYLLSKALAAFTP